METLGEVVGAALMGWLWAGIGLWVARWRAWADPVAAALVAMALVESGAILGALAAGSPADTVGRLALFQAIFSLVALWWEHNVLTTR